jgi:hypothetical protein
MSGFYLQVEALNLSDFIFDTDDLSTRRGGSLMLLKAIEEVTQQLNHNFPGKVMVIQEAASVGLYHLEPPYGTKCEDIKELVRNAAKKVAPDATFGVACTEVSGDDADAFMRDRQKLLAQVRWGQMQSLGLRVPDWNNSGGAPCDLDTVRPGVQEDQKGDKKIFVSNAVFEKRKHGKDAKQQFYKDETRGEECSVGDGVTFVSDLDDLTSYPAAKNLHHKMALIYVDGNHFGEKYNHAVEAGVKSGKSPWGSYAEESDGLIKNRRKMLAALLQNMAIDDQWRNNEKSKDAYRIETLLWGGDEIIWVVPAWKGWETLQLFFEYAKQWTIGSKPVTHAAGVVFCHHNAPIQRMIDLVHGLCEVAKAKSRDENLIAFQVLESFDFMGKDLDRFRENLIPGHAGELVLKADAMGGVEEAFAKLKAAIPRKQVYKAAQEAHEGTLAYKKDAHGKPPCVLTDEAGSAGVDIAALKACLGSSDEVFWYHVRELWDYIPKHVPPSTGKGVAS